MCLGIVGGCEADPVVALHLRNAADYRLPTFGPHGTKLGHSWYQWIIKSDLSGWFDNSKKEEVSGQIEWMWGWSRGCTPPKECCRLPPTYLWATWHQTRAFLISVNNKSDFLAGLTILNMKRCLGRLSGWGVDPVVTLHLRNAADYRLPTFGPHGTKLGHSWYQWIIKVIFLAGLTILNMKRCLGRLSGWGVDPVVALHLRNAADYRLSYFCTTWHQIRAFLISVNNKKWFFWLVCQFWKRRGVWADWVDGGLIPWLHST